ncbi:chemotaxis protein CheB [Spirosoma foliorum]|uniref:protein-glutamate methylesterase n=1 Tax=Spirosoma foliorum TaxID=2710596 RepID=A0A7G5H543_9BACT|nr:chemotaxis protein CheB [Spirosoma foliorum]QMW06235.1 chemotaxis protein CheB [Spirosoma foliorum]
MEKRNIIVIGASAGGFEAIQQLIAHLPPDLDAAIFIVWHMAPTVQGVMPQALRKLTTFPVAHAVSNELIRMNRIYIAPPDHHLLLENDHVRLTHGPKENRFRPAIDPLFRSAAYAYGNRVIGVILSGALDDGTAGLWTIKEYGGMALVQDPKEAPVSAMPESAIRQVTIDAIAPIAQLATLLVQLVGQEVDPTSSIPVNQDKKTKTEIRIAAEDTALGNTMAQFGQFSAYACPDCHGVMIKIEEGSLVRYRCHTGHAYSADSLLASVTGKIEESLYSALRGMDERVILLNQLGDQFAAANKPRQAALYFQLAQVDQQWSELLRQAARIQPALKPETPDDQPTSSDGIVPALSALL